SDRDEKIRTPANIKDTNKPDSKRQKSVAPKTPPPPPANSSSLNLPSDLFFLPFLLLSSKAMAEPPRSLPPKREVFAWNPVVGADFYIIEISKSQDFQNPLIVEKVPIEQFLWIPPEKVIYYWRVAAGQKSGRMGLFSPPAARDLTLNRASPQDLEKVQSKKELLPESNTLVTAPIPPPPLQRKEDQSPPKKEKKPTVLPPETVETESNPPTLTVRREPPMKSETEFAFFFAFVPEYNSWVQKKGSLNSKLEGWAAIATDLRLNMPHQEKGRSLIHAILSSSDWVRAEKADLPFQDDFSDWQGQLKYVYIPSKKNWTYGLVAHHSGYLMRVALEKVTWRQWNGFGASIGHLQTWKENTTWDSSITLIGASKLWLAEWSNQLDFSFPTWGMKLVAGPRFKIQYLKGEELGTSTRGQLGLQLGFEW
ncbi:MAG: hypothetical protein KDD35_11055, partial [Bdellovibrionales bacterium]|nr:hypothetical protein [Bdellovibrionales bacterium]